MHSPFPGMDPYLEGSEWTSVHTVLAVEIARQLTPRLLPRYIARTEKRYVVASLEAGDDVGITSIFPDASIARPPEVPLADEDAQWARQRIAEWAAP